MKFSIDRQKALALAEELGIDVKFDSKITGILEKETGNEFPIYSIFFSDYEKKMLSEFSGYKLKPVSIPVPFQDCLEQINLSRTPEHIGVDNRYKIYDRINIA